jgi:hypothetical protein
MTTYEKGRLVDLEKEITKLEKYLNKQGRSELVQELRRLGNDDRRGRLLAQAVHEQEIFDTKEKDQDLKDAREKARELNASYSEQLRMLKKISRFIHLLIEESGKA